MSCRGNSKSSVVALPACVWNLKCLVSCRQNGLETTYINDHTEYNEDQKQSKTTRNLCLNYILQYLIYITYRPPSVNFHIFFRTLGQIFAKI